MLLSLQLQPARATSPTLLGPQLPGSLRSRPVLLLGTLLRGPTTSAGPWRARVTEKTLPTLLRVHRQDHPPPPILFLYREGADREPTLDTSSHPGGNLDSISPKQMGKLRHGEAETSARVRRKMDAPPECSPCLSLSLRLTCPFMSGASAPPTEQASVKRAEALGAGGECSGCPILASKVGRGAQPSPRSRETRWGS